MRFAFKSSLNSDVPSLQVPTINMEKPDLENVEPNKVRMQPVANLQHVNYVFVCRCWMFLDCNVLGFLFFYLLLKLVFFLKSQYFRCG